MSHRLPHRCCLACLAVAALAGCGHESTRSAPGSATTAPQEYLPQATEPVEQADAPQPNLVEAPAEEKPQPPPPEAAGLPPLSPDGEIWLDAKGKRVLVGGRIVRTEGQLEMSPA